LEIARENVSLARLAEAHFDAVAILAEAGRLPDPGSIYGVWASEVPGQALSLWSDEGGFKISGTKKFCSGVGLIDRALVTVGAPEPLLVDVDLHKNDLRKNTAAIQYDDSSWKTPAFEQTHTATASFNNVFVTTEQIIGDAGWYLNRLGFWHGACGPAACWAGGAQGLVDFALSQHRDDPHTLAHLGAMSASAWALHSYLESAGHEIDQLANTPAKACILALSVRHLVEQACTDILRRLTRAYGPHPLAMDEKVSKRYQEVDLDLRQSHAERDLEALGRELKLGQSLKIAA